jgi:hypothetical protein
MVLLIFMEFLLQAPARPAILLRPRLRRADPSSHGAYIDVTVATVAGRESIASEKMLSASAESLVFRIIYRTHRIERCWRHDEQPLHLRSIPLLSQLIAAGA